MVTVYYLNMEWLNSSIVYSLGQRDKSRKSFKKSFQISDLG
jgi:hypothetical protein